MPFIRIRGNMKLTCPVIKLPSMTSIQAAIIFLNKRFDKLPQSTLIRSFALMLCTGRCHKAFCNFRTNKNFTFNQKVGNLNRLILFQKLVLRVKIPTNSNLLLVCTYIHIFSLMRVRIMKYTHFWHS